MEATVEEKGGGGRGGRIHMPRATRVKNKAPAPIQITAEQLLREAQQRQDAEFKPPKQKITDPEELEEVRFRKRKQYEDILRRNKANIGCWLKYAAWEESQGELDRARSVYERAIDVDYRQTVTWLKYAEMEMKNKNVNSARNVWERATSLLPRVDTFWLRYTYFEEIMGNYPGARAIFEKWMKWEPDEHAWNAYIRFEMRCNEIERARAIFERFTKVHATVKSWLRWAHFEEKHGGKDRARAVYEATLEYLGEDAHDEKYFISFARFEEKNKEIERARALYKYALDHVPKKEAQELYKMWVAFEKKNGDKEGIEDVIVGKRRFQYQEELKNNALNYDLWFDYVHLEETYGDVDKIREVYELAIHNVPPSQEKYHWKRYIYLWINYALFEELEMKDYERTREIYKKCLSIIPHNVFTFRKIWLMFANFEIRQKNLQGARQILGTAIGRVPHVKIFKAYTSLELQLGNVDRCRIIYEKWLEYEPANCEAWISYAHLERDLGEIERSRALFQLAVDQPQLDMPELLWKSFIDFEIEQEEFDRARTLYQKLLERTKHVKVWVSFAQFEASTGNIKAAREVYSKGYEELRTAENKEERVLLVESWRDFEKTHGDKQSLDEVEKKMPKKIIKKRALTAEDGSAAGWEEYYDYIFPGEESAVGALKILEKARMWKQSQENNSAV